MLHLKVAQILPNIAQNWPQQFFTQKVVIFKLVLEVAKYLATFLIKFVTNNYQTCPIRLHLVH